MPVLVVIPARLGSTRLPRKLLQPLGGVPLVVRVAERIQSFDFPWRLVVAVDSSEIEKVVSGAGFEAILTAPGHPSGTDRIGEVISRAGFAGYDVIVNIQGDSPFLPREAVLGALEQVDLGFDIGTAAGPLEPEQGLDTTIVKVAVARSGRAVAFSRQPIAGWDNYRHLGLYCYARSALERLVASEPVPAERAEGLEQLRAMEMGLAIGVARIAAGTGPAVDTEADLAEAREYWTFMHGVAR